MPPVKTSFRSLCKRNCFKTKISGGRTGYFYERKGRKINREESNIFVSHM